MNLEFNASDKAYSNRFKRLGRWYILALALIASIAIVGQILVHRHLQSQVSDSRTVNLAGTQRYRSQAIAKMSVLLYTDLGPGQTESKVQTLEALLLQWKKGHEGLQRGDTSLNLPGKNSKAITKAFQDLDPYFQNIYNNAHQLIAMKRSGESDAGKFQAALQSVLENESIFLEKMDRIVFQYDQEAQEKVSSLGKMEYILLAISLLVIALEILFVFRPTTIQVNETIDKLMLSEQNARKLSKEIGALYSSLEKTYEELSIVNQPTENPRLLAKADRGGNVTFVSENLIRITGVTEVSHGERLCDLFSGLSDPDNWMDDVVDVVADGNSWYGEVQFDHATKQQRWLQLNITPVFNEKTETEELVVIGSDITRRKEAEKNMSVKNRADIEKKINQQKFRSVLILEGQEEERKRIAMDIHDGIGQMLTSLKFQVASIDLHDDEKAAQTIREIEQLTREVIREVRKVTFNLKPTVLGDYGLRAALNVFIQEIGKLTDIRLSYDAPSTIERLPQKTENNIFRIIQEAINNAIKYSGATIIQVTLEQSEDELIIRVNDNGKGFDPRLIDVRSVNIESGRGFFNMYERTEYINGKLQIDSSPGNGTTVLLHVPLRASVAVI